MRRSLAHLPPPSHAPTLDEGNAATLTMILDAIADLRGDMDKLKQERQPVSAAALPGPMSAPLVLGLTPLLWADAQSLVSHKWGHTFSLWS